MTTALSPPVDSQPNAGGNPTPVDGGTLVPPSSFRDGVHCVLQGLSSTDSSLIADTSHVQQLINHGADVNAPDNNGWTPLHTAAYHGQEEIVRILLAASANVNARNKCDETPLHLAAKWPQDRVVEALLSGAADLSARNKRGRTPAHVAALFNRHAILDRLLNAGADVNAVDAEKQTPLHLAVRANCPVEPELVKTLIRHNANLEHADIRGRTPLHFLPSAQDWLHWAAYEGRESLLQVLLAKPGVRPDCYSEEGLTPLHLAAHVNNTNMVTMLLNAGAKVNAPSQSPTKTGGKDSNTYGIPLPGAPGSITAGISISSQLKAYGSSKLPPVELTALHIAAERGSAELIRVLVAAGAKVNIQGDRGMPPLHVAVWEGNTAAVVSLLAAKASVSLKSKAGGFTSVHCACLSSRATPELLALLLDNGGAVVIEERCQEGWTALHLACQSAPPAMVELLLARGARPTAKGKNGRTAADCASKRPEILQLLHVYTGGKVPLPYGVGMPSAAAAANGLLTPNGAGSGAATGGRGGSRGSRAAGGGSGGGRGGSVASSLSSSSSCSQAGLLPGTAAMLEPLENVEATLAALLADMGGALCSLQAGAVFGAGACSVDPVGHCIRPLDKRLVMVCTLGCQFSFHLQCWKSAREVLKERWANFNGSLAAEGRYCCFAPGCLGYIREQAICDGAQMQSSSQSRLYLMPQEVYDSLPQQAKPIGGGVPPPPPGGCDGYGGIGNGQHNSGPLQPPLPAGGSGNGGGGLAALGPSLTLAQAMVQAATAVGNMVGGSGRRSASQLAAAIAATGGLPALLAGNGPPVPQAMSAREAAAIAAQTLGMSFGGSGGPGSSACVVEELGNGDDLDEELEEGTAAAPPPPPPPASSLSSLSTGRSGGDTAAATRGSGAGSSSAGMVNGGGTSGSGLKKQASAGSGGGGGSGSASARRGAKSLGSKSSAPQAISSAAAAEMLQQLQGLQQAVAAVQSAVGAGVHSMGLGMGGCGSGSAAAAAGAGAGTDGIDAASGAAVIPTAAAADFSPSFSSSRSAGEQQQQQQQLPTVLEPPREILLPPRELPPARVSSGNGEDGDGDGDLSGVGENLHEVAPVPPPRRRNQPMPPMSRRAPQPLTGVPYDTGRQPLSPQLATPPPATSLLTPGVQPLLSTPAAVSSAVAAAPPQPPLWQPDSSLAPILMSPVTQTSPQGSSITAAEPVTALPKPQLSLALRPGGGVGPQRVSANGCVAGGAAEAGHENSCGSSHGGCGARSSPKRNASSVAGAAAGTNMAGPASAVVKPEQKLSPSPNGPTTYGTRMNLSAASLGMDLVRGNLLASSGRGAGSSSGAGQSLPGLTITRAAGNKCAAAAAVVQGPSLMQQHAGSYEPGGYARAVCPGLRPGVHRVTLSGSRSTPLQPLQPLQASAPAAAAAQQEGGADAPPAVFGSGSENGTMPRSCGDGIDADGATAKKAPTAGIVIPAVAIAADVVSMPEHGVASPGTLDEGVLQSGSGGASAEELPLPKNGGAATEGPAASARNGPVVEVAAGGGGLGWQQSVCAAHAAEVATVAAAAGPVTVLQSDIVLAALHSLRQEPSASVSSLADPGGAAAATAAAAAACGADAAMAATAEAAQPPPPPCCHLLLESGDIPLLAGTPGMLEAWLSAHVGSHGALAAYRILAPQAAVAVSLESAATAAAAAGSLRRRPHLLVAPLTVAPLAEFPDDEVLAARAHQVARSSCPPGDRSWMKRMVELWEQLQALPPVVRDR